MLTGVVEHIHIGRLGETHMTELNEVEAIREVGLAGDRYSIGGGFWRDDRVSRSLTLIEAEAIETVAEESSIELTPDEMRRNLTTRGIRLNDLVGRLFWVGRVLARGTRLCEPCTHLVNMTGKPILYPMVHRAGLRADLLTSGLIRRLDEVRSVDERAGVGVIVQSDGRVLLGRRLSDHGRDTWSFPGGKPEFGETAEACALRELREETGLDGSSPIVVAETLDAFPDSRTVFRTKFVGVNVSSLVPVAREPYNTERWDWYRWDDLPKPLFVSVESLLRSGFAPKAE